MSHAITVESIVRVVVISRGSCCAWTSNAHCPVEIGMPSIPCGLRHQNVAYGLGTTAQVPRRVQCPSCTSALSMIARHVQVYHERAHLKHASTDEVAQNVVFTNSSGRTPQVCRTVARISHFETPCSDLHIELDQKFKCANVEVEKNITYATVS